MFCRVSGYAVGIQVQIQDLAREGGPASEAESCPHNGAELHKRSELSVAGSRAHLRAPGSFWVFNAQIYILPREYRATMAEENLHHSGPVCSFDLKISTIVALFPLITLLMTPP